MPQPRVFTDSIQPDFGLPWPRYELKDYSTWTDDQIREELRIKTMMETNASIDANQFGWTLESWRDVCDQWKNYTTHCVFGGNRSGKSSFCARLMMHLLLVIPEAKIRLYHNNDEQSINDQQAFIWDALPERFKTLSKRKGINHSIVYSQKAGFTGNKLILPPHPGYSKGSEMVFGTYEQYKNNPQVIEGWWAHAIWSDEEMPQKMYERLLTRLYDVRGRMVMSFTTVMGWSPLVADILGRTKTLTKRAAPLVNNRMIQTSQESLSRPSTRIYYFWTDDNPFIPAGSTEPLRGRPVEEILATAYGIPSKPALSKFPRFDESIHVIPHEKLPWLVQAKLAQEEKAIVIEQEFTRYCVIDPSGAKPWTILWFAVAPNGVLYAYREYPDVSHGAWAEPSQSMEGKAGPAQKPNGFGIQDYVDLIKHAEEGEEIFERLIDPRLGAALTQAKEGSTSIITELEDAGMPVVAAPGLMVDHGLQLINNALAYDVSKPISSLNTPHLFISENCGQLIDCIKAYLGAGPNEASKDFIDCVRYLLEHGADFISKSDLRSSGGVGVPY